jgi:hypothetical protein
MTKIKVPFEILNKMTIFMSKSISLQTLDNNRKTM